MVDKTIQGNPAYTEDLDAKLVEELDISVEELMDEIVAYVPSDLPEGAFTTAQFREREGLSEYGANKKLYAAAENKLLDTKLMVVGGRRNRIWWRHVTS